MISYILKTILCSSVLILLYYLFLEREKMYRFNRFYLLFSIVFSFVIPLISLKVRSSILPISDIINLADSSFSNTVIQQIQPPENANNTLPSFLLLFYLIATTLLLCRFFINIFVILFKIKNNSSVRYYEARLVLTEDKRVPYSFLKYVFIQREDYERGTIEKEIMGHEITHVRQKHSLDILFFELLICFVWFNPLLILYRKAIQLNHEFLADEFVIKTLSETQTYQLLLLDKARQTGSLGFSSSFNFLLTKRRIIMMNKNASKKVAIFKQVAIIPVIAATGFLFMTKIVAQDNVKTGQQQVDFSQKGVSPELMSEYKTIINKYKQELINDSLYIINRTPPDKWVKREFHSKISSSDNERLSTIFFQMNNEQQEKQIVRFYHINPNSRTVPTKEQLESFKDQNTYEISINYKIVSNEVLNNYTNTDFAYVNVGKGKVNAAIHGKPVFGVYLMTNGYFQSFNDMAIAGKIFNMGVFINNFGGYWSMENLEKVENK